MPICMGGITDLDKNVYLCSLIEIVKTAIENDVYSIQLGPTEGNVKQECGAEAHHNQMCLNMNNLTKWIITPFLSLLKPREQQTIKYACKTNYNIDHWDKLLKQLGAKDSMIIDPDLLANSEQRFIVDKIYRDVNYSAFTNISSSKLLKTIIMNGEGAKNKLKIYIDEYDHRIQGYASFHIHSHRYQNDQFYLAVSEIALHPFHRRHVKSPPLVFIAKEIIKYKLKHPFRKFWVAETLINPLIYDKLHHLCEIYPSPNHPLPDKMVDFLMHIAQTNAWDIKSVSSEAIVRKHHWNISQKFQAVRGDTRHSQHEGYQYYLKYIDNETANEGMLLLIHVTFFNIFRAIVRTMLKKLQHLRRQIYSSHKAVDVHKINN